MPSPFLSKAREAQAATTTESATPAAPLAKPALTGLAGRFGGTKPAASAPAAPLVILDDVEESDGPMDLADLPDSEEGEFEFSFDLGQALGQFDDETPAQAPTRELPDDLDSGSLSFISLIDDVYGVLGDSDLLGNVIRSIMIELKSQPQYMRLVADDDIRTWVKSMRNTMGMARIKKTEEKAKRAPSAGKGKGKAVDQDMLDAFADLGIGDL